MHARDPATASSPPAGAVALLFTDIEGSTRLARRLGPRWPAVIAEHHRLLVAAVAAQGGHVERADADEMFALFRDPAAAVAAAAEAQRAMAAHDWPSDVEAVRVRMGLHQGVVERSVHGCTGLDIHLAARVQDAANGGQVLMTAAMQAAVAGAFDTEPVGAHRLKDFPEPERLFQLVHDGRRADAFPRLRTDPVRPTNLPAAPRPLVGRAREERELRDAVLDDGERLVTVVGFGGVGKTHLATTVAASLLDEHPGGAWLVSLAGIRDPAALLPAIAAALGADDPERSVEAAVAGRLATRPTLLVLDTFEHLADAAPALCALLDDAPACRVIVTSQLPLRVHGERLLRLRGLEHEAGVALFRERLGGGTLGPEHAEAVGAIVDRLDGLPLAIELAAARASIMSAADLLRRLDRSLAVLARGPRDAPERHRSLRAALAWTVALLGADERTLLERLAIFAGPAPLEAIEAVTEAPAGVAPIDALEALSGLVDASLVRRTEHREYGMRFTMAQAVRDYAAERLAVSGDEHDLRFAHGEHLARLAEPCRFWEPGPGAAARARVLALEEEQRPALAWSREHDHALHLRLAGRLCGPMLQRSRIRESMTELETALAQNPAHGVDAGWAAVALSFALREFGRPAEAKARVDAGLATLRAAADEPVLGLALRVSSGVHLSIGDHQRAREDGDEALSIATRSRDVTRLATELGFHASMLTQVPGHQAQARHELEQMQQLLPLVEEEQLPDMLVNAMGDWAMATGDWALGARCYARSIAVSAAIKDSLQVAWDVLGLLIVLAALEEHEAVLELNGFKEALLAEVESEQMPLPTPEWGARAQRGVATAWQALGRERAAAAVARGHALTRATAPARVADLAAKTSDPVPG